MSQVQPKGEVLLRTIAMPADTNASGDIFGGWIMSQMDIAGAILASEASNGRIVTVAVDSMKFIEPVNVGDIVCCYGEVSRIGNTSVAITLEVWVTRSHKRSVGKRSQHKVTEAVFTYVAVDENGKKRQVTSRH